MEPQGEDNQEQWEEDPMEPDSARSDSNQLHHELEFAIIKVEEENVTTQVNERSSESETETREIHLERRIETLEDHVSQLVDHARRLQVRIADLHGRQNEQDARTANEKLRMARFPICSHLMSALDDDGRNLFREDLDDVLIHVTVNVCEDVELTETISKLNLELPVGQCLSLAGYLKGVASMADEVENRDGLWDAGTSDGEMVCLAPQLLCLDYSQNHVVSSFSGFGLCTPDADACYSQWLARQVLFGSRKVYKTELHVRKLQQERSE